MAKEDVVCIYNGILLSQKKWDNAICSNTDEPRDCHTEKSESDRVRPRKRTIIWYCLQAEPKWHKWAYLENEQTHRLRQGTYQGRRMPGEKDGGRDSSGVWDGHGPLLYLKWVTNKDPPDVTGNSAQCRVALHRRGVWGRMDTCIHMAESLCCAPETITRLLISCTPI